MKRRSIFAGIVAAFAPALPVASMPAAPIKKPATADFYHAKIQAYKRELIQRADKVVAELEAQRAELIAFDSLVKETQLNIERQRLVAKLGVAPG